MSESKVKSAMIAAHDALDSGGVFTTAAKALEWMESLPENVKCICAPFVLDHPEYGNVGKEEMQ